MSTPCKAKNNSFVRHAGAGAFYPGVFIFTCLVVAGFSGAVFAQTTPTDLTAGLLCNIVNALGGTTGKAIASFGIVALGIMALYGKTSWGTAFVACAGIALIFGAAGIITAIGGQSYACAAAGTPSTPFVCSNGQAVQGSLFDYDTIGKQQVCNQQCINQQNANAQQCQQCLLGPGNGNPANCPQCTTTPLATCVQQCLQNPSVVASNTDIFSAVILGFQSTVGVIMSTMYCTFSYNLTAPLNAAMTLFVTVFGIMVMTGMVNFNVKQAALFVSKIALIWAFALDPSWGIGVGYKFFINFAEEGSNIMLQVIPHKNGMTPSISAPDAVIIDVLSGIIGTQNSVSGIEVSATCLVYIFILIVVLLIFMPMAVFFFIMLIVSWFVNFFKALFNYLTALVIITFLFTLSPFFICFALFRTTMPLFEAWIKQLIGFSLQMVLMFGFLVLLALLPFIQFFQNILSLLREYDISLDYEVIGPIKISYTFSFCSFCDYTIDWTKDLGAVCQKHIPPIPTAAQKQQLQQFLDSLPSFIRQDVNVDINYINAFWDAVKHHYFLSVDYKNEITGQWVIPLWSLPKFADITVYIGAYCLAFLILSKVIEKFMKDTPKLSAALGNLPIASALGGGGSPGDVKINNPIFNSIEAAYLGFRNSVSGTKGNFFKKFKAGLVGRRELLYDRSGNVKLDKHGNPRTKRKGGIIGGLLYGAGDSMSLDGRQQANELKRIEKEKNKAQKERDQAATQRTQFKGVQEKTAQDLRQAQKDVEKAQQKLSSTSEVVARDQAQKDLEKAQQNLEQVQKNHAKAGRDLAKSEHTLAKHESHLKHQKKLYGQAVNAEAPGFEKGLLPGFDPNDNYRKNRESSIGLDFGPGDETDAKLKQLKQDAREEAIYGRKLKKESDPIFGFTKGQDTSESTVATMNEMRGIADNTVQEIEKMLETSRLSDKDKADIQARIKDASVDAGRAVTDGQIEKVIRELNKIKDRVS